MIRLLLNNMEFSTLEKLYDTLIIALDYALDVHAEDKTVILIFQSAVDYCEKVYEERKPKP